MIRDNAGLIGESAEFLNVLNAANIIAATEATTLIHGDTGTGKELFAQQLHFRSQRADNALVTINCASLPETLVESELFGHKKGAFTGADSHRKGRIKAAHNGTLFLDEIGEMPLSIQAKFLRFLESGECQTLGEEKPERVNVRVIAATNRDLQAEVNAGNFRQDLYYRLNIVPLRLPNLKERASDIPLLLKYYAQKSAQTHNVAAVGFDKEALNFLRQYAWPGNIRELRNFVERMAIFHAGQQVQLANIPAEMQGFGSKTSSAQNNGFELPDEGVMLDKVEVNLINQALNKTLGNRTHAARLLGLTRDTLLYRMKKYAIA